ncbi:MAG: PilZ domain-containing protein [Planctomycetes bacterium]|nr:PilZ domain-containing protein [Planctomycetota bacterium]
MAISTTTQTELLTEHRWRQFLAVRVAADFERGTRRSWRRYPIVGEVKAQYQIDDQPRKRSWDILSGSARGLTIRSDEEVPLGTKIALQIHLEEGAFPAAAVVKHCTQTVGGYKLGIQFVFADPT